MKLLQRVASQGTAGPGRQGRPPDAGMLAVHAGFLIGLVETTPDITMPELA